jgi:hypothetical protein
LCGPLSLLFSHYTHTHTRTSHTCVPRAAPPLSCFAPHARYVCTCLWVNVCV